MKLPYLSRETAKMHIIIYEKNAQSLELRGTWGRTTATLSVCYYSATIKIQFFPISSTCLLYFTLLGRILWLQRDAQCSRQTWIKIL